jgi:hypothetical protein
MRYTQTRAEDEATRIETAPVVSSTWAGRVTPSALSIVQARCVGLAHFSAGFVGAYYCFLSSVL